MKLFLIVLSLVFAATFSKADERTITFVYITEYGLPYQPDTQTAQPAVRILFKEWGYDLKGGADEEVCIVTVQPLRGGDAAITPPAGSFLILEGTAYRLHTDMEATQSCQPMGM